MSFYQGKIWVTLLMLFLGTRFSHVRSLGRGGATARKVFRLKSSTSLGDDPNFVPIAPVDFGSNFSVPSYPNALPLETINMHPLDVNIKFEEEYHTYFWKEEKLATSVTKLVEKYFEKFDPDVVIEKMKNGRNWPRKEYMTKAGTPWSDKSIKDSWENLGLNARNRGTWMHYNIERMLNGYGAVSYDKLPEMKQFSDFYEQVITAQGIQPYRTEWRIAAPDLSLAGSVDFVGKLESGYVICDWKRSKKLGPELQASNKWGKQAKPPLEDLEDSDATKYFLQLNVYRYILQKYYGLPISKMILASFHPQIEGYLTTEVPILQKQVEAILEDDAKNNVGHVGHVGHAGYVGQPRSAGNGQSSIDPPSSVSMQRPF